MWPIVKSARDRLPLGRRLGCSFCKRRADSVERLVAGASAYICDACIMECVAVLEREGGFTPPEPEHRRPNR
jgi:ATP-dependent Clp protease ATP-binding subunit ClpX